MAFYLTRKSYNEKMAITALEIDEYEQSAWPDYLDSIKDVIEFIDVDNNSPQTTPKDKPTRQIVKRNRERKQMKETR
jgi:hypothetical protein